VALNEPREVIALLRAERIPRGLAAFYDGLRREIRAGRPIENKLLHGEVVEDTSVSGVRRSYTPAVTGDDFVLAVKNTREFLLRLAAVRRVLPEARIVACVRDPVATIASWKGSFDHLRGANVGPFLRHRRQLWLPRAQRRALERIGATPALPERRALWWRFQAERVLERREQLLLVRYEELAAEPMPVLERILDGYRAGELRRSIEPSSARSRAELLDEADVRAIEAICRPVAQQLGYPRA
jgi:hypothetical protein